MPPLQNFLTAHLKTVDETYTQYFFHTSYYFVMLMAVAIFALIHALFSIFIWKKIKLDHFKVAWGNGCTEAV